jgi:hypothetical protein
LRIFSAWRASPAAASTSPSDSIILFPSHEIDIHDPAMARAQFGPAHE